MRVALPSLRSPRLLSLVTGREANDVDVARALIEGQTWATAETWYRMAPMVLTLATRVLGSRSEAEDLTQEVFSRVFRKATQLREPERLRSFVYSFAIHALKSELRKRKLRAWLPLDAVPALWDETRDVESRELLRRFHALLDRLSARDRLVFVLRRMEDMTIEQIAAHLEISPSTVKRSLSYATERLTRWIGGDTDLLGLLNNEGSAR